MRKERKMKIPEKKIKENVYSHKLMHNNIALIFKIIIKYRPAA